jgi:poly-gamma-glutamate synthesis protein (capsule biosynthesis protein)
MERKTARVVIAGDTCPIGRNEALFRRGDGPALLGDLAGVFAEADLVVLDLECPLIGQESPIAKCGPSLGAPLDCVKGLRSMGVGAVVLANNHVMDHGAQGLLSTIKALEMNGIAHVGAGENAPAAARILLIEVAGCRVGVLAMAEHEFGVASGERAGANALELISAVREIEARRSDCDRLVIIVHGGNENYPYPRPSVMEISRFLVERGASAVIWQHTHCTGCVETYLGAPIVYGQGNFIFDYPSSGPAWHEGALVCLDIVPDRAPRMRLVPYRQSDGRPGAHRMTSQEEKAFLDGVEKRSEAIRDESFVARQWESFCDGNRRFFLDALHGRPGLVRRAAGRLDLLHRLDSPEVRRMRLHMVRCESYREALITLLAKESTR